MNEFQTSWGRHQVNGKWEDKPLREVYAKAEAHYGHKNFHLVENDLMTGFVKFREHEAGERE